MTDTITVLPAQPIDLPTARRRQLPIVLGVLLAITTLTTVGLGIGLALTAQNVYHAEEALATTRAELARVQEDLNRERAKAADLARDLEAARSRANAAEAEVDAKKEVIQDFDTCVTGLIDSQQAILDFNYATAAATLNSVVPTCKRARDAVKSGSAFI
jgi:Skp family chaperone for outer membrane proteins